MRLARRLTLYLLLAVVVVFGVDTWLSVRSHLALFDADMRRDEHVLGTALGRTVEQVWQRQGEGTAAELLETLDQSASNLRVRLVHLDADAGEAFAPDVPRRALQAARRERSVTHVRREGEPSARLYTYVPLSVPTEQSVALELMEPLSHEVGYLQDRFRRKVTTAAVMVVACGLVAWLVGLRLVGKPVQALVDKARRIGRGDFSGPLVLSRGDELSQLAGEMNGMAADLEDALRKVQNESAARVRAVEQLRHADRLGTVGKLASGLAHELGTPLNVVAGRAKMIANGEIEDAAEGVESARIIADQAERMTRIVRQLLDFARHRPAEKRRTDLGALARQTASLLAPIAFEQGVTVGYEEPAEPVFARIDAAGIQQALTNLLLNAIQASPPGSAVTISLAARESTNVVKGSYEGPWALIGVRDHGAGISAEAMPQLFDPFFTTKPVGEGTGLGLSVSHGIVEEHGGLIEVASEPSRGSCFQVWLPQESA